jgi:hypothetical protein
MPFDDSSIFEQSHRAINGRNRDTVVNLGAPAKELFDIRVIIGLGQHARYDTPLFGHSHALGRAKRLDVLFIGDIFVFGNHALSL